MKSLFAALILSLATTAWASELSTSGVNQLNERVQHESQSRYQLARILEAEARVSTVRDALAIKTTGLQYVRDLSDFEFLAIVAIANPSPAYVTAVADFIAQYVARYTYYVSDVQYLRVLETRTHTVAQAMAVKRAGLKIAYDIETFLSILPFSVPTPSDAYKKEVSAFVAQNIAASLDYNSPIYLILEAETYALTVQHSMMVKNAGLVAVHSKADLLDLAQFGVTTPSDAYRLAVDAFIRDNIGRYP